jgi:hypothetical protein
MYFARQGVLLKWPLQGMLNRLSGESVASLEELRENFRQVTQSLSKEI